MSRSQSDCEEPGSHCGRNLHSILPALVKHWLVPGARTEMAAHASLNTVICICIVFCNYQEFGGVQSQLLLVSAHESVKAVVWQCMKCTATWRYIGRAQIWHMRM